MAQQVDIIKNKVELVDNKVEIVDGVNNPITIAHNTANGKRSLVVNVDESQCSFSEEYSSDQTNLAIITPPVGGRLHIHGGYCATDGTAGEVQIDFLTSGKKVFRMYVSKENTTALSTLNIFGDINEPLILNTTVGADKHVFIIVNYMCE